MQSRAPAAQIHLVECLECRTLLAYSVVLKDGILRLVGTPGDDYVEVRIEEAKGVLVVQIGDPKTALKRFPASEVSRIFARGLRGNDSIRIESSVPYPTTLIGGHGNDRLEGGGGNDRILGGSGDDFLQAGPGAADLMVGGAGNDGFDDMDGGLTFGGPGNDGFRLWYDTDYHVDGGEGDDNVYYVYSPGDSPELEDVRNVETVVKRKRK